MMALIFYGGVGAFGQDCAQVSHQLYEMQKAQGQLLQSMVKKNDALAETLDLFATHLNNHDNKSKKNDIQILRESAQSFRGHSERELLLVSKFQKKSLELIEKAGRCLLQAKNPAIATNPSE